MNIQTQHINSFGFKVQLDYSSSHSLILVRKGEVGTVFIITQALLHPVTVVV